MNITTIHQLIRHCYTMSRHGEMHWLMLLPWDNAYGCSACRGIRVVPG